MSESRSALRVVVLEQARGVWGAQRYLLRLAGPLSERGVELSLACPRELEIFEAWRAAGLHAVHLDLPIERTIREDDRITAAAALREAGRSRATVRQIADMVRDDGYDAIWSNAHWTHMEAGLAGRRSRTPTVLHLHEEARAGVGTWLRAGAVRLASRSVAVSAAVAAGLPSLVRNRVTVIPNGVDTDEMSPLPTDSAQLSDVRAGLGVGVDDVMVFAATRLDPPKRIEDLIEAVRRVADPRVHLVVAGITSGFPEYEQFVRQRAADIGPGTVTFCGNRDDTVDLFRASDVVLHAGVVEGMPLGLIEAQSCGKPVVAYSVAGVPEAVVDGVTGLLASAGDVAGLSAALARLINDPVLRLRMGGAAREQAVAHHRLDDQADRIAALTVGVCRGRRRG